MLLSRTPITYIFSLFTGSFSVPFICLCRPADGSDILTTEQVRRLMTPEVVWDGVVGEGGGLKIDDGSKCTGFRLSSDQRRKSLRRPRVLLSLDKVQQDTSTGGRACQEEKANDKHKQLSL